MNCKTIIIIDNIIILFYLATTPFHAIHEKSIIKKTKNIMYNKNLMISKTKYNLYIIIGLLSINCLYSLSCLLKNVIELCIVVVSHKMACSFFFAIFE